MALCVWRCSGRIRGAKRWNEPFNTTQAGRRQLEDEHDAGRRVALAQGVAARCPPTGRMSKCWFVHPFRICCRLVR